MIKPFVLSLTLFLSAVLLLPAQPATNTTPAVTDTGAANAAPDDVLQKLSGLVHAGKYPEARQLVAGLLLAYPDDPMLAKVKSLLDQLLAPAQPAATNYLVQPAQSDLPSQFNSDKLTGMDKVEYNSLMELGREAQQTSDLEQQKSLLHRFMDESKPFLEKFPNALLLWQLRGASAISLNDPESGYEAGQKLLASGLADTDPSIQRLLLQLNLKGWLDKQQIAEQNQKKFGWVLGTWNVSRVWRNKVLRDKGEKEEFQRTGTGIEGYEISGDGTRSTKPDLRGIMLDSGEISWECYLPPDQSDGIYVFRVHGGFYTYTAERAAQPAKNGPYYPSGWQPVNSAVIKDDKQRMTIIIPTQWPNQGYARGYAAKLEGRRGLFEAVNNEDQSSAVKNCIPITLRFTQGNEAEEQLESPRPTPAPSAK